MPAPADMPTPYYTITGRKNDSVITIWLGYETDLAFGNAAKAGLVQAIVDYMLTFPGVSVDSALRVDTVMSDVLPPPVSGG